MMKKILLQYRLANSGRSCTLSILYSVERDGDTLSLHCYIEASHPHQLPWLQTRNFIMKFLSAEGVHMPVNNEADYEQTADALRLKENAAITIMNKERLNICISAAA